MTHLAFKANAERRIAYVDDMKIDMDTGESSQL